MASQYRGGILHPRLRHCRTVTGATSISRAIAATDGHIPNTSSMFRIGTQYAAYWNSAIPFVLGSGYHREMDEAYDQPIHAPHERLRNARRAAGFKSASAAARQFGWGDASYRHHENGTRTYGIEQALQYAAAFAVPPMWLLDTGMGASDNYRVPLARNHIQNLAAELSWNEGVEEAIQCAGEKLGLFFVPEIEFLGDGVAVARKNDDSPVFHLFSPDIVGINKQAFISMFVIAVRAPTDCPTTIMNEGDLVLVDSSRGNIGPEIGLWLLRSYDHIEICYAYRDKDGQIMALDPGSNQDRPFLNGELNVLGKIAWIGRRI